jgi:4-hydroxybenzoate polyprenyltransferase
MGVALPVRHARGAAAWLQRARLVIECMRPRHWVKNAFVLAGVVFAGRFFHPLQVLDALAVTAAFCLASGCTYLLNDARDAEDDALNLRTATRPIARGELPPSVALRSAALVGAISLAAAALVNWESLAILAAYLTLQLAYSYGLKHVLFLDVIAIAAGFVLRAVAGGLAISVTISSWLLLSTGLLATFLGLVKRRGEALSTAGQPRPLVREDYSIPLLDSLISVVAPATLVVYSLYAVNGARTHWMLLTVPFVLYGLFRVLFLLHRPTGIVDEPATAVLQDRPLLACIVLWAITAAAIVAIGGAAS